MAGGSGPSLTTERRDPSSTNVHRHARPLRTHMWMVRQTRASSGDKIGCGMEYDDRMSKKRLTVSVDAALVDAGVAAVTAGSAPSMSAWVSEAMAEKAVKDRRLEALSDAVSVYEADHGVIGAEELAEQARRDREAAARVTQRRGVA